tara:strand:- start:2321 stop:2683 length:363 start_codon:yes stop_codon:yes gene_type:complete
MNRVIPMLVGLVMIVGAAGHIFSPELYAQMIPAFLPMQFANISAAVCEAIVGVLLFVPKYRANGGIGFMLLMFAFLPIHVWDALQDAPAVGSPTVAVFRLVIQFLLIYTGWWIYKLHSTQ